MSQWNLGYQTHLIENQRPGRLGMIKHFKQFSDIVVDTIT